LRFGISLPHCVSHCPDGACAASAVGRLASAILSGVCHVRCC
jgi:hypothetical protein